MKTFSLTLLSEPKKSFFLSLLLLIFIGICSTFFPGKSYAQVFEFRHISAGADTGELYISSYWHDDDTTKWGGVFRSTDNGKTLSVQYKDLWPSIVYYNIFGDSLSGTVYLLFGLYISQDFGISWEYKSTPITDYFEGIGGCLQGEIYIKGHIASGQIVLYHGMNFGDSLYLMNTAMGSLGCIEAGSLPGEVYALKWPYWDPYRDTLGLAFSSNYGQTFTVTYIDTSIATHLYRHTLAHGPDTGEIYITGLDFSDRYHVLHSWDHGHTFTVKHITAPISLGWDNFSFVAGRKPGTFYMLKTYLCATVPLHNCMEIHYSQDYGETYTIYYHELDSTYTGISLPSIHEKPILPYPNPVSDKLMVDLYGNSDEANIQLFDLTGRLQLTTRIPAGQGKVIVDVSPLNPGIYLLKVTDREKVIGVGKVVVE